MREAIAFLVLTVLLVGAPAAPLLAELRDPNCRERSRAITSVAEGNLGSRLRALAVQGHRLDRCLPSAKVAAAETQQEVLALGIQCDGQACDRSW